MGKAVGNLWQAWAQSLTQSNLRQTEKRRPIKHQNSQKTNCIHLVGASDPYGRAHRFKRQAGTQFRENARGRCTAVRTTYYSCNGKLLLLRNDDVHDDFYEMRSVYYLAQYLKTPAQEFMAS
jgi:hypothetical protein